MLIDHILGENLLRMLHKKQKKCRLLGRKDKFFAIFVKTHGCGIIAEWTAFQSIGIVEYQILVAADQCFYFGTKYKRSERLGDMQDYNTIIGAIQMRLNKCPTRSVMDRFQIGSSTLNLIMSRYKALELTIDELEAMSPKKVENLFYP